MIRQIPPIPTVFAIEGLDRLGKSTLIEGIRNKLGYYEVIHFSKPQLLDVYKDVSGVHFYGDKIIPHTVPTESAQAFHYQRAGFLNSMLLAKSGARIIFDRWHLGEVVYSPMYRNYGGDYVFQQELDTGLAENVNVRLILLIEDFQLSRHSIDDGQGLGPWEKRKEEQHRFLKAFEKSNIIDKRIICVTSSGTGGFRAKEDILAEALEKREVNVA